MATIPVKALDEKHDIPKLIDELEQRVTETHRRYEMYFAGIERGEPRWMRDDCKRRVAELNRFAFRNVGLKYRYQNIKARLSVFENHWNRVLRQIEEGTYRRHRIMAERHMRERHGDGNEAATGEAGATAASHADGRDVRHMNPAEEARRLRLAQGGTAAVVQGRDLDDASIDRIHKALHKVKVAAGDDTPVTPRDELARTLRDALPQLREKYGERPIDIKLVNRDGRVVVRAVPRKEG